tara:strand:- start:284 stop:679 length:396 start_codon:yes stop_codon:yes gene_type:complete
MKVIKITLFFVIVILLSSCKIKFESLKHKQQPETKFNAIVEDTISNNYKGWWIYGEGLHIFKDEESLLEYELEFPNENIKELETLYLAVCEMEYFPMESMLDASMKIDHIDGKKILVVYDFEILYIEGCGE